VNEFPFFPQTPVGETVYSTFCRTIARSGLPERQILRELTGQPEGISYLCSHPGYLLNLSTNVPAGHPWRDVGYILRTHTGIPYYLYFDPPGKRNKLLGEMATMNSSRAQTARIGFRILGFNPLSCNPRFCSSCAEEDRKETGFTYYRREHQLPGVSLCWKHGICLVSNCNHCSPYPMCKAFRMPGKCICQKRFPTVQLLLNLPTQREPLLWLAKQSAIIVNSAGTPLENARSILRVQIIENGLGLNGQFNSGKLAEALEARFGRETLEYLEVPVWVDGNIAPWIPNLFANCKIVKRISPMLLMLAIGTIFDSVNDFEAATQESLDMCASPKEEAPCPLKVLLARERIRNFIANNPNATRTLIIRKMHRTYEYLLKNDKVWLWSQVPSRHGQNLRIGKRKKRKAKDYSNLDKKMAEDSDRAFDDIYGTKSKPIWATKTPVLRKMNLLHSKLFVQGKLPLTQKILDGRCESIDEYRVRLIRWAITKLASENETISLGKIYSLTCLQFDILKKNSDMIREMIEHLGLSFSKRS